MIKILVTGDFCPVGRVDAIVGAGRSSSIYNDFMSHLEGNDLNITNLECPLIDDKQSIEKSGPVLQASERGIEALKAGKMNLVTLSNNHILDHGLRGLQRTIELCTNAGIAYTGAGLNLAEAERPYVFMKDDIRISVLNFSENEFSTAAHNRAGTSPLNPVRNYYSIKKARETSDRVIVIIHGGHEGFMLPSPRMTETFRFYVDAGADVVICHHAHCFSGYEWYREKLIFYGLGNFLFDWPGVRGEDWNAGYALKLFLNTGKTGFEIIPYKQCDLVPGLVMLKDDELAEFMEDLERLNDIISDDMKIRFEWERLVAQRKKYYEISMEPFEGRIYRGLRERNLLPSLLTGSKRLEILNIIRCESHRDLAIESLTTKE